METEDDMRGYAGKMARELTDPTIIALYGDLGAGKTTFSQGFLAAYGVISVKSPTYGILNTYDVSFGNIERVHHFDLYRIEDVHELYEMGFEEILHDAYAHVLIEWPNCAEEFLPSNVRKIVISHQEEGGRAVEEY